jgi:hypothetical protein
MKNRLLRRLEVFARRGGAMSRRLLFAVFIALSSAVVAGGAVAAGNEDSTTVFTEPVEWVLPAGLCPVLPPELAVTGEGTARAIVHTSVDAQGVLHVALVDTINGTATDNAGDSYQWNYHNAQTVQVTEFPFVITVTDHFNLVGAGAANQIHTSFTLRLLVDESGTVTRLVSRLHGFPGRCDPL